jgi:hypothetical protein
MGSRLHISFAQPKGVNAKRRVLEVDGVEHEMQWGDNELELLPGEHRLVAYLRAPLGNKIGETKALSVCLEDGRAVQLRYHVVGTLFAREFRLEIAGQEVPPPAPMPSWAWFFMVACVAIPVVALGGAVPTVLGVLGAGGCAHVAKAKRLTVAWRILASLLITAMCWLIFIVVVTLALKR